jgi:FdhE protein
MPFLQACRVAWAARIPDAYEDAACPVCGASAALVEARGLERRLRHRCGRCGADWAAEPLRCPFCGTRDHGKLTGLVSERAGERGRVESCGLCRGYLKTITTLTAAPPAEVALLDLETVHLDVAAVEHDFQRPPARPRRVALRAGSRSRARRLTTLLGGRG